MHYYIVFLCNWPARSNAIVRSVELTTADPSSYVKETNDYVYLDLTAHLDSNESKAKFGRTVQEVMTNMTQKIGSLSINKQASTTTVIRMADVLLATGAPESRRLTSWNDVVKPAWQRLAHTSSLGTL